MTASPHHLRRETRAHERAGAAMLGLLLAVLIVAWAIWPAVIRSAFR